jgi:2-octaprenylphenol hydroxylase
MADRDPDLLIVGAGMVGAAAACLFARAGFSVAVVESGEPAAFDPGAPFGLRVSAISPGAQAVLAEAGVWEQVEQARACAYRRMQVEDRGAGAVLEFNAAEFGLERLGTIVENGLLQWALWQQMRSLAGIELHARAIIESFDLATARPGVRLANGREIRAALLVGADGADSAVRRELGIGRRLWHYGQQGLVAVVRTAAANPGVAWQRFMDGGPLAFLPLADGRSSIVWSRPDAEARRLLELDEQAFCAELQAATAMAANAGHGADGPFGAVLACGPRAAFPLSMQLADRYAGRQGVLVGDAAHVVHPLAGQGVNLGLLDAAALVEVLAKARDAAADISGAAVLQRYARWRRSEAELMARGIHGIRALFLPEPLTPLRRVGLGLLARSWLIREAFVRRAAGLDRAAPALARGTSLEGLLHRKNRTKRPGAA